MPARRACSRPGASARFEITTAILAFISITFALQNKWAAGLSVPFALFVYCLEMLVALIQAYVFTMLTSLFIGLSLHPSH